MQWIIGHLILIQCLSSQAEHDLVLNKIIDIIQRRGLLEREPLILAVPQYPEDLPKAERIMPGHTLIQPARGMLKSSVKFPQRDFGNLVYGNLDNLGVTYGKSGDRIMYTGFRKANSLMATLLQAIKEGNREPSIVVIAIDNERARPQKISSESYLTNPDEEMKEENDASEVLDNEDLFESSIPNFRRKKTRSKSKFRNRVKMYSSSSSEMDSSASSDYEKNPGNPYTVHKNAYLQNWLWNHAMDGDHMNINSFAPQLQSNGPSGAEIFFGRKWWYFNQDDYKPMG